MHAGVPRVETERDVGPRDRELLGGKYEYAGGRDKEGGQWGGGFRSWLKRGLPPTCAAAVAPTPTSLLPSEFHVIHPRWMHASINMVVRSPSCDRTRPLAETNRERDEEREIHACAGCVWEIQLRPLARRASYRYHNSKKSDAPPPPSSCPRPRRSRRCPLAFPSAPFLYIVCMCMYVYIYIYKTSLYVYITPPTLPTFLFIGFVGKSSPFPLAHFLLRVLRPCALPPCYFYHPLVALLLFFFPNHRLHLSTVVVIALLLALFSHLLRPLFLPFFLLFRFLSPRVTSRLSPNTLTGISFSKAANCARWLLSSSSSFLVERTRN